MKRKWRDVKKKLPKERQDVLVYTTFNDIKIGYLRIYHFLNGSGNWTKDPFFVIHGYNKRDYKVTHWLPLPEKPKEEKE